MPVVCHESMSRLYCLPHFLPPDAMLRLLARLRRPPADPAAELRTVLERFRQPDPDTLELLRRLVACLRPKRPDDEAALHAACATLLDLLESDPALCAAFRRHFVHFLASRRLTAFFTDSGILPGTGFFSEWWRILWHRLLPEVPDERRLKDCTRVLFDRQGDWLWLERLPAELSGRFWRLLSPEDELSRAEWRHIRDEMLEAVLVIAHRVSGLGVESELLRASRDLEDHAPRFLNLATEALEFTRAVRARHEGAPAETDTPSPASGQRLLAGIGLCRDALNQVRRHAREVGTTLHLTYALTRAEQSLVRLTELVVMLAVRLESEPDAAGLEAWAAFAREAFVAENRRHSLAFYWSQLSGLLALRVTENAARSGEHYICETRTDYRHMWLSAMGAGIVIGGMALFKILASKVDSPLFVDAVMYSLNYGLGFVLIYLLGFTIATKQPAMTAQALAVRLSDMKPGREAERERLVDVVAAVTRSQVAAIGGNILLAFPVALLLAWGWADLLGHPPAGPEKAEHLLHDLDILGWALPHAAIAGFYLYLSGLITGYFDNQAACNAIGERIGRLRWLGGLLGQRRAQAVGAYIERRLGGIMGNFLFGCMLGSTGTLGVILGLPLDIRHIAFSAANLGYGLFGLGFDLPWQAVAWALLGIAAIGLTNLTVSFALALRTALNARQVRLHGHAGALLAAIGRRFVRQPGFFLLPPRGEPPREGGA